MENKFLTGRDIILFSITPWDFELGSNAKQFARKFAEWGNRVLYINRALDRFSLVKYRNNPKIKNRRESFKDPNTALQEIEPNIFVLNPVTVLESVTSLPFAPLFDFVNKINGRRIAREINVASEKLGFKDCILFIDNDFFRGIYLPEMLKSISVTVYYIRDYLISQPYYRRHGKRLEPALIKKADLVISNSLFLRDYGLKYNPRCVFVGQGCDLSVFSDKGGFVQPPELDSIPRPLIGYTGAILTSRLDIELILNLARKRQDWSFVFIGPEDNSFANSELHQLKNVYFLGKMDISKLPSYIYYFQVCINPQIVNEMTIGNYPLKVDEYLAMGKPVVATKTVAMEMFSGFAKLCSSEAEYEAAIEWFLESPQEEKARIARKEFAASHNWDSCVEILDKELSKLTLANEQ